jgi:hypothetical protein
MTPERFARGMTFDDYVKFTGSPENLGREGFDVRRFSLVRPRIDWSGFLRERHAKAAHRAADGGHPVAGRAAGRAGEGAGAVRGLVVRLPARRAVPGPPGGGRRPGDARLHARRRRDAPPGPPDPSAGGNADLVREYANQKNGQKFASIPVAVFFTRDFAELYRYIEYPAIYRKERLFGHMRAARPGETDEQTKARGGRDIATLLESPFVDVWAQAAIAEIISALHERLLTAGR